MFLTAVFAVFVFVSLAISSAAQAAEAVPVISSEPVFEDVPIDHPYRRDVIHLLSAGVLEEDVCFRPEEDLTVAEAIIMAEKLFGDASRLPDWNWWKSQDDVYKAWEITWDFNPEQHWLSNADTAFASREFAAYVLLHINRENEVPHPEYYSADRNSFYKSYLTFCAKGYENTAGYDSDKARKPVSRGEYCHLLLWAKDHIHDAPAKPALDSIVRIDTSQAENVGDLDDKIEYLKYKLCKIPWEIRKMFVDDGFTLQLVNAEHWAERFGSVDLVTSGWFVPKEKVIAVCDKYCYDDMTLIHEFGHYLDYKVGYSASKSCRKLLTDNVETVGLTIAAQRKYGLTDGKEFFADAYWSYLNNSDTLKKAAPKTYQIVADTLKALDGAA